MTPPTPSPTRETPANALFLTLHTTPPSPQHTSALSDTDCPSSPEDPLPIAIAKFAPQPTQTRRNAFSITTATTCSGDVFLSPSTVSSPAQNGPTKAKRPTPMKLKIPAIAQPPACVSPTRSTLSVPGSPFPALPSPLYRIIDERYGTTPRGDVHMDAGTFPFPASTSVSHETAYGVTYGSGITMSKSMQEMQTYFGMQMQMPAVPAVPYTPTSRFNKADTSPTQATFLHVPSSPFTPPFTPPHSGPVPLPVLELPKPRLVIPLPPTFLPPTPTSPALTVPLPPSRPVSPAAASFLDIDHTYPPLPDHLFPAGHRVLPDFLHRYALHDSPELGSGGFGFVLLAQKRYGDRKDVAVKFIVKEKMPKHSWILDRDYGMLPMEITVLRLVKHENIVEFIEFFQDEVYFYLVQELHGTPWALPPTLLPLPPTPTTPMTPASPAFLTASCPPASARPTPVRRASYDLFECIERHTRLSEDVARHIFRQVVDAVSYLHSLGIFHRDIKDENILIDESFRVKLIDFGSAAITDTRRSAPYHDRFFGTMNFASPEILLNKPYRAPPAEIWTLGILLHILITGECPFSSTQAAIEGRISPTRKGVYMSRECENLVRGCLLVDVETRLSIGDVLSHPWLARK